MGKIQKVSEVLKINFYYKQRVAHKKYSYFWLLVGLFRMYYSRISHIELSKISIGSCFLKVNFKGLTKNLDFKTIPKQFCPNWPIFPNKLIRHFISNLMLSSNIYPEVILLFMFKRLVSSIRAILLKYIKF
jgi:hypothetical protein